MCVFTQADGTLSDPVEVEMDPYMPVALAHRNVYKECLSLYLFEAWWKHFHPDKKKADGRFLFEGMTLRKFKAEFGFTVVYGNARVKNVHGDPFVHPHSKKEMVTVVGGSRPWRGRGHRAAS